MESWFFNASVVILPAEQSRVGLGFTATLAKGGEWWWWGGVHE